MVRESDGGDGPDHGSKRHGSSCTIYGALLAARYQCPRNKVLAHHSSENHYFYEENRPSSRMALIVAAAIFLHQNATAGPATINLGAAANFAILGGQQVTFDPLTTTVTGDVGVWPGNGSLGQSITGVPANLTLMGSSTIHNSDVVAQTAQGDLTTAYGNAIGAATTTTFLGTDNQLGGQTLVPGVYQFGHGDTANLIGTLTLDAQNVSGALFIFQATSDLITASGSNVDLINGADPCNVIWQVTSSASLGSGSDFDGTILALTIHHSG
jgi:Ice-binding-like